jgi:DNA-binding transcriptional MerR regulator
VTYRIRTVAEMTGIPRNTLIAWERRYGVVRPTRHENGYRSYSDDDVSRLLRIKNAQAAGLKLSEAVALLEAREASAAQTYLTVPVVQPQPLPTAEQLLARLKDDLVHCLIQYDKEGANRIIAQLAPLPFSQRLAAVYFPALRDIGDRWERGDISVVQEHYGSSVLRAHFASLPVNVGPSSSRAPHAACTTFPEDLHELSALALSIQLSLDGHRVSYLGPNLPAREVAKFVRQLAPRLVCVPVVLPVSAEALQSYADVVAPSLPPAGLLVIGGRSVAGLTVSHHPNVSLRTEWGVDFAPSA